MGVKYASNLQGIITAVKANPLDGNDLDKFYCETMETRTGDKYSSPILDIYEACKTPSDKNAFLLIGHRGSGKSTELNRMAEKLRTEGYYIESVQCALDLDLNNIIYTDLLILMGNALLKIAEEHDCELGSYLEERILKYWTVEEEKCQEIGIDANVALCGTISAGTKGFLSKILDFMFSLKGDLKFNEETRTVYREKVSRRASEWINIMTEIADTLTEYNDQKQPIIIFEDLDKLNPEDAGKIFYNNSAILSGVSFPIIYTFPISMSYESKFGSLGGYFETETLPMIKVKKIDGTENDEGICTIKHIVEKRMDLSLFDDSVLELIIKKTGGSIRDLFSVIVSGATRAMRRQGETISIEDVSIALEQLKTSLTRRIDSRHYEFLAKIYSDKSYREQISDKNMLLEMLQASVVLEYNSKRWHDVHPLVGEFLEEQGFINR